MAGDRSCELVSTAEVAAMLGVSVSTVQRWRFERTGPAPVYLTSATVRYRRADVVAWIAASRRHRPAPPLTLRSPGR
jgi:predicted DNA-binding transcriptional regulator AlpA